MSKSSTAPPNRARMSIGLRPKRSAMLPQIGEAIIIENACPEYTSPASSSRLRPLEEPSSLM